MYIHTYIYTPTGFRIYNESLVPGAMIFQLCVLEYKEREQEGGIEDEGDQRMGSGKDSRVCSIKETGEYKMEAFCKRVF